MAERNMRMLELEQRLTAMNEYFVSTRLQHNNRQQCCSSYVTSSRQPSQHCTSHRPPSCLGAGRARCATGSPPPAARVLPSIYNAGPRRCTRICRTCRKNWKDRNGRRCFGYTSTRWMGIWWSCSKRGLLSIMLSLHPSTPSS